MRVGEIKEHEIVDKDIYVLYSDGVSDNLFIDGPEV
jgi:serine/threonine protein phosphatase PrpC